MSTDLGSDSGGTLAPAELAEVFVTLADSLVDDYDVVELMERLTQACVHLLGASAAGLLVTDQRGGIQIIASSSESIHLLEVLQVQNDEGPCLECVRTGSIIEMSSLEGAELRWPQFIPVARAAGFTALQALPLRLRSETIGALNLLFTDKPMLTPLERRVAQALADVATIGILQQRAVHRSSVVAEQLQRALNSRVVIEQAKGMLSQHMGVDMDAAFRVLRSYARNHNLRLTDLSSDLTGGVVAPATVVGEPGSP